MTANTEEKSPEIVAQIVAMTPEARDQLIYELRKKVCLYCGNDQPCYCTCDD